MTVVQTNMRIPVEHALATVDAVGAEDHIELGFFFRIRLVDVPAGHLNIPVDR